MNRTLNLLALSRAVRREAAVANLAAARREFDLAHAAFEHAHAAAVRSIQWRTEILTRCALGSNQALRDSVLPACEALLQQHQQQLAQAQIGLRMAQDRVTAQRKALTARERDSMRLQEWQQMREAHRRREEATQEDHRDEEQMQIAQRPCWARAGAA